MSLTLTGRTCLWQFSIMSESNDYYTYVYELILEHDSPAKIPTDSLMEVLTYFESIEDYEKCKNLQSIIETRK